MKVSETIGLHLWLTELLSCVCPSVYVCALCAGMQKTSLVISLWLSPLPSDSLILKCLHPAATQPELWLLATGCVWLCTLKPASSWCFRLSVDHNEQQIWIAVIHKPTLACIAYVGGYECIFFFICLCFVLAGLHMCMCIFSPLCSCVCVSLRFSFYVWVRR